MSKINLAIDIAIRAHAGQVDKAGKPYILHPLAVMTAVRDDGYGEDYQIVAVLHDVVEDSSVTLEEIGRLFGETVRDAVDLLTRRKDESYVEYIRRLRYSPIAKIVKLADLQDNLHPRRLYMLLNSPDPALAGKARRLLARYEKARELLLDQRSEPELASGRMEP